MGISRSDRIDFDTKMPTGFVDGDNVTVTYDPTGKAITLTHASGVIAVYHNGKKISLTSPWVSTAHGVTNGIYWLTIDQTGASNWGAINTFPGFDQILVANINYGATTKFAFRECHGAGRNHKAHEEMHRTIGAYRVSGCQIVAGSYVLNSNAVTAVTPAVDAGVMADEDLKTAIAALTDGSTYTRVHLDTGSPVFTTGSTFPFPDNGTDILYNANPSSGTALVAMTTNNRWVNVYGLLCPATASALSQEYRIIWLTGQQVYTTSAAAQSEDFRTLVTGNLAALMPEFVPYIRLTYKRTNSNLTRNAQFDVNPTYLLGSAMGLVSVSGLTPTDHALLTGRAVADSHPASASSTDVSLFAGGLTSADTDVQKALDTLSAKFLSYYSNVDGGIPSTVYGGILNPVDGGAP